MNKNSIKVFYSHLNIKNKAHVESETFHYKISAEK